MEKHEKLLNMLMDFNPLVRFTAVCTQDGEIEWSSKRDDVTNIISLDETKSSIKRAAESWNNRRRRSENGAGRGMYTITAYEKMIIIVKNIPNKLFVVFFVFRLKPLIGNNYL